MMRIVFVHGACVKDGSWWWHRTGELLAEQGLASEAPALPSCGETGEPTDARGPGLAADERLALGGECGCGKAPTAQAVMRLVDPVAGTIRFGGADVTHLRHRDLRPLRRRMQLIYQAPYDALDPRFRVRQAVEEPLL